MGHIFTRIKLLVVFVALVFTSAPLVLAKKKKKGARSKPRTPAQEKANIDLSTLQNVSITPAEMCDACHVTIESYAKKIQSLGLSAAASGNKRKSRDRKQTTVDIELDGAAAAKELCFDLKAGGIYRDYVYFGCARLVAEFYLPVFGPFNGKRLGGLRADAIDYGFVRDHKRSVCRGPVAPCDRERTLLEAGAPGQGQSNGEGGASSDAGGAEAASPAHAAARADDANDGLDAGPAASAARASAVPGGKAGRCAQCLALAAHADEVTRRRRPDPSRSMAAHFGEVLGEELCGEGLALAFDAHSSVEALCEAVVDDHAEDWAAAIADRRAKRQQSRAAAVEGGLKVGGGEDRHADGPLSARLCGAAGAGLCSAADVAALDPVLQKTARPQDPPQPQQPDL